jgi:hypothetical protein
LFGVEMIAEPPLATPTTKSSGIPDYFVTDDGHFAGEFIKTALVSEL